MSSSPDAAPPAPGSLFAIPLEDGRWTACLVARKQGDGQLVVVSLDWLGARPPTAAALRTCKPLRLTHHSFEGQLEQESVPATPPPAGFRFVGTRQIPRLQHLGADADGPLQDYRRLQLGSHRRRDADQRAARHVARLAADGVSEALEDRE